MNTSKNHTYALTRGLGGLFIFASFQFLENNQFTHTLVLLALGIINLMPYLWMKRWTSMALYGVNSLSCAVFFYEFIQMGNQYIQWLWLALFVYYIIRLRDLYKEYKPVQKPLAPSEQVPDESL